MGRIAREITEAVGVPDRSEMLLDRTLDLTE
jgi:hypothetical protein